MRDTAGGTPALPGKEAASSSSVFCLEVFCLLPQEGRLMRADALEKRPCLGSQECLEGVVRGAEGIDEVSEEDKGGGGVEEGVVPGFFGDESADLVTKAELVANAAERVLGQAWPGRAGKQKGIDPRAEAVAWKSPQKALFGALAVGDDDRTGEAFF